MAQEMGLDCSNGASWLFSSIPPELAALREKSRLSEALEPGPTGKALRV